MRENRLSRLLRARRSDNFSSSLNLGYNNTTINIFLVLF
jgi:hypothetical protein